MSDGISEVYQEIEREMTGAVGRGVVPVRLIIMRSIAEKMGIMDSVERNDCVYIYGTAKSRFSVPVDVHDLPLQRFMIVTEPWEV